MPVKGYNPRGLGWEFPPSFTSVAYNCLPQSILLLSPMASTSSSINNSSQANSDITVCLSPRLANPDGCRQCPGGQHATHHFQRVLLTDMMFSSEFTVSFQCFLISYAFTDDCFRRQGIPPIPICWPRTSLPGVRMSPSGTCLVTCSRRTSLR